jgi:hypothetical protein
VELVQMIGQLKFAWIDFKRSFLASLFTLLSQIVTYSAITISIGIYSISKPFLSWTVNYTFFRSYMIIAAVFIAVCIIIGGVVTSRSIELKFQNQKEDIGIMKNVGGKSRWIYSYFIFNQILTAVIVLVLGILLGVIFLLIILGSFNYISLFKYVQFMPILGGNLIILIISYIKAHYTIIRFVSEKDFEETTSKLSKYKSIFELNSIVRKASTSVKMGLKNFLRSGKILSSLLFSFFLVFSSISFVLGPLTIAETYTYQIENGSQIYSYLTGETLMVDFYNQSLSLNKYENSSIVEELNDISYFSNTSLSSSYINDLRDLGIDLQEIFLCKLKVEEIPYIQVSSYGYNLIGENRSFYATIIGYSEEFLPEDLFVWGEHPEAGRNEVLIGDTLDHEIFDNSSVEKIRLKEESTKFSISGVIKDEFAAGFTVYTPLNKLIQEGITANPNLIMFEDINSITYNEIITISNSYGYELGNVSQIINDKKVEYAEFSYMYSSLGGGLFIIFSFQIVVFCFLYFLNYRKDYELLYKLGVAKRKIYRINITATLLHVILGMLTGIYLGSILARYFIVPAARLSWFGLIIGLGMVFYILLTLIGSGIGGRRGLKSTI